ncbi:uncharacterized protein LOC125680316 [Ostrea edulis]|uniref:uncharacterized protein LOC125680316 n=1 Tax=Ostrea edulis TaxID=37623 RepID=UPI0024AFC038|nr:uncharacterized protein LOC125680316 [Ostrea edulis]
MKVWISVLATCLILLCHGLITVRTLEHEKFHDCSTYSNEEDIPKENAYCTQDRNGLYYCKTWQCDPPNCPADQQVAQERDTCPICPDTCTDGGRIFNVDEGFKCVDGANRCRCIGTGVVVSTRMGTNKYSLCGAPLPELPRLDKSQ